MFGILLEAVLNCVSTSNISASGSPLTPNLKVCKLLIGEFLTILSKVSLSIGMFWSSITFRKPSTPLPCLSNLIKFNSSNSSGVTLRETPANGPV